MTDQRTAKTYHCRTCGRSGQQPRETCPHCNTRSIGYRTERQTAQPSTELTKAPQILLNL